MAKKKQFAGKKTKLAELPLTRVLEQKAEDEAAWGELQTSGGASPRQLFLSLERSAEVRPGLLTAAYQQIIQELAVLQADLEPERASSSASAPVLLPLPNLLQTRNLKRVLLQARESLQDLHRLLSD